MDKFNKVLETFRKGSDFKDDFNVFSEVDSREPLHYISTGDDILDMIISNRKFGGMPTGRYLNIYSDSGVGKSLMLYKLISNVQKKGGFCAYYDTEGGAYKKYMEFLGVKSDQLLYSDSINVVEDVFASAIELMLALKKDGFTKEPVIIAIDSMTAVTTRENADLDSHEIKGYGTGARKQMILNDELRKINKLIKQSNIIFVTTDQTRDNINGGMFQPKKRATTGNAQEFWSDVRLEMKQIGQVKDKNKEKIGNKLQVKLKKSRISPPDRSCTSTIIHTKGMDNNASWFDNGKEYEIFPVSKGTVKLYDKDGEEIRINGKLPTQDTLPLVFKKYPDVFKETYDKFAEKLIVEYVPEEDVEIELLNDYEREIMKDVIGGDNG